MNIILAKKQRQSIATKKCRLIFRKISKQFKRQKQCACIEFNKQTKQIEDKG
jgi:hypothetical protein